MFYDIKLSLHIAEFDHVILILDFTFKCVYCRIFVDLYLIWSLKCSCWTLYIINLGVIETVYFILGCKTYHVTREYVVWHHNNVICKKNKTKKQNKTVHWDKMVLRNFEA